MCQSKKCKRKIKEKKKECSPNRAPLCRIFLQFIFLSPKAVSHKYILWFFHSLYLRFVLSIPIFVFSNHYPQCVGHLVQHLARRSCSTIIHSFLSRSWVSCIDNDFLWGSNCSNLNKQLSHLGEQNFRPPVGLTFMWDPLQLVEDLEP